MQINIIAVGERSPYWVEQGVNQYINRMPNECQVKLRSVSVSKREKNQNTKNAQQQEQEELLKLTPEKSLRIALDRRGSLWSTDQLLKKLNIWMQTSPKVSLYIGGPDGFTAEFLKQVDLVWSLSNLTMPHMLVRIVLVEQLYRAWTMTQGHPYHRD